MGPEMLARWIAISLIAVVLVLVGVIAGTALLGRTPDATGQNTTTVLGAGTERLVATTDLWTVTADLTRGAANEVTILLKVENETGEPADQNTEITASLQMLDMAMGKEPVPLTRERPEQWRGIGRLSMNGRWALEVAIDGESVELPFEVVAP
jgi:hypothetical protein